MIPVVLFVYSRAEHLARTLACLKENSVPKMYIYSDGPKTKEKVSAVNEVRKMIRAIDWCETIVTERTKNLGLGKSILAGVTEVLEKEGAVIVVEDDLEFVQGTYQYLCAAMTHYQNDTKVMSVTGWTHPAITPRNIFTRPYFDGRAECWVWGTWKRAWDGILDNDALSLINTCNLKGIDPYKYGADLPEMAKVELKKNIWAVRFLYWHIVNKGLCMRPPWSMVNHIGFDKEGTNVKGDLWTKNEELRPCPPIPSVWPGAYEYRECAELHRKACEGDIGIIRRLLQWVS